MDEIKEENRVELVNILDSYFDPEKEAIVPPTKPNPRRRSFKKGSPRENRRSRSGTIDKVDKKHSSENNINNNNNNDILATPDLATRSPRRQRRSRRRFTTKLGKTSPDSPKEMATTLIPPIGNHTAREIAVA